MRLEFTDLQLWDHTRRRNGFGLTEWSDKIYRHHRLRQRRACTLAGTEFRVSKQSGMASWLTQADCRESESISHGDGIVFVSYLCVRSHCELTFELRFLYYLMLRTSGRNS